MILFSRGYSPWHTRPSATPAMPWMQLGPTAAQAAACGKEITRLPALATLLPD